jgi:limonene-1,2-epoxide hydrolase
MGDSIVFFEPVDNFRISGRDVMLHWSSVWELDPAGKITTQRDYWDAKELAAQLA